MTVEAIALTSAFELKVYKWDLFCDLNFKSTVAQMLEQTP